MITVLHYAPGFNTGGIESRLLDWYRNTDRSKVRYVLLKLNNINDTDNIKEFQELGGVVFSLSPLNLKSIIPFVNKIKKLLISENVDIVHVHDVNSGLFVLMAAKQVGIYCRILHSRTTANLPHEKNVLVKCLFRKIAPLYANHYFACSTQAGEWGIGKRYKDKIQVIKNGIQIERFYYNPITREGIRSSLNIDKYIVIGTVGRLSDQKNIPFLLDILRELIKENPNYRLVIVGDGDRNILQEYFDRYPISDYVILTGAQKNVQDYYMAFDLFCGTSLYEGFGTTAIEAQATGLPVIISNAFPKTVVVTNHVKRLPIDEGTTIWVNSIKQFKNRKRTKEDAIQVEMKGYSAKVVAKELEGFYLANM